MHINKELAGHFGNHIWEEFWFKRTPLSVYLQDGTAVSRHDLRDALCWINPIASQVGLQNGFFRLRTGFPWEDATVNGVFCFIATGWTPSPRGDWRSTDPPLYLNVPTKGCYGQDLTQPITTIGHRWPLVFGAAGAGLGVYGLGGVVHELLHCLGIADHYCPDWCQGPAGFVGVKPAYPEESLSSNPGLTSVQPHDIADILRYFSQGTHYADGSPGPSGPGAK